MAKGWRELEDRVRALAKLIWDRECVPTHISGTNVDGVIVVRPDYYVLLEITEQNDLDKVRNDLTRLAAVRLALISKGTYCECYSVLSGVPSQSMIELGENLNIVVCSVTQFEKRFFDFERYSQARTRARFGSAVNPITGKEDNSKYVKVSYEIEGGKRQVGISEIAEWLQNGRRIILLGEFGSGKSRCIRELFHSLADSSQKNTTYPVAIDLRDSWGLRRQNEILRRHLEDLGLVDRC